MVVLIVVIAVVVILLGWFFGTYNSLVSLRNKVKDQWAQIDVQLKRRADLIPNLVETVKGYAKHEKGTLEDVIKAINAVDGNDLKQMKIVGPEITILKKVKSMKEGN